jgi:hypothetical protein
MKLPHEYTRGLEAGEMMRKDVELEPQFQAQYGEALNKGMTGE